MASKAFRNLDSNVYFQKICLTFAHHTYWSHKFGIGRPHLYQICLIFVIGVLFWDRGELVLKNYNHVNLFLLKNNKYDK